jgi:hypothetical protein
LKSSQLSSRFEDVWPGQTCRDDQADLRVDAAIRLTTFAEGYGGPPQL